MTAPSAAMRASDAEKRLAAALGREFDYHDAWPIDYMDRVARILREYGFSHHAPPADAAVREALEAARSHIVALSHPAADSLYGDRKHEPEILRQIDAALAVQPTALTREHRVVADKWWRNPERHVEFQRATGLDAKNRDTEEYHQRFRLWALSEIGEHAALAASPAGEAWRPMSEAPTDRDVLFWCDPDYEGDNRYKIGRMYALPGGCFPLCGATLYTTRTERFRGWQELPAPPAEAGR